MIDNLYYYNVTVMLDKLATMVELKRSENPHNTASYSL